MLYVLNFDMSFHLYSVPGSRFLEECNTIRGDTTLLKTTAWGATTFSSQSRFSQTTNVNTEKLIILVIYRARLA